ncbi:MAG: HAD family phosphatase [Pseudomonadales bacterium]|nr:HAD family phosphatase [Pseudomonadales bacterium]
MATTQSGTGQTTKDLTDNEIEVLLFDLGGVIIELSDLSEVMAGTPVASTELMQHWAKSEHVFQFESGRCDRHTFARGIIEEFGLSHEPEDFLEAFGRWPTGFYEGSLQLLAELKTHYHTACLSNTNDLHWDSFATESAFVDGFHDHFLSFRMGLMKPGQEIFRAVLAQLDVPADRILFFDDSPRNVEAARQSGLQAEVTRTPNEVKRHLQAYGLW